MNILSSLFLAVIFMGLRVTYFFNRLTAKLKELFSMPAFMSIQ